MNVNYLGVACFADLFFKDNSSTSQDSYKPEAESTVERWKSGHTGPKKP